MCPAPFCLHRFIPVLTPSFFFCTVTSMPFLLSACTTLSSALKATYFCVAFLVCVPSKMCCSPRCASCPENLHAPRIMDKFGCFFGAACRLILFFKAVSGGWKTLIFKNGIFKYWNHVGGDFPRTKRNGQSVMFEQFLMFYAIGLNAKKFYQCVTL